MNDKKISPKKRHKARCFAVQALYHWQLTQDNVNEILMHFLKDMNARKTDTLYFQAIMHDVVKQSGHLDELFTPYLDRPIAEIGPVELAILRLGTYELTEHLDIPYKVVLNEAVELTKMFGPEDAHKYINAVLDKVATKCRGVEVSAVND